MSNTTFVTHLHTLALFLNNCSCSFVDFRFKDATSTTVADVYHNTCVTHVHTFDLLVFNSLRCFFPKQSLRCGVLIYYVVISPGSQDFPFSATQAQVPKPRLQYPGSQDFPFSGTQAQVPKPTLHYPGSQDFPSQVPKPRYLSPHCITLDPRVLFSGT